MFLNDLNDMDLSQATQETPENPQFFRVDAASHRPSRVVSLLGAFPEVESRIGADFAPRWWAGSYLRAE